MSATRDHVADVQETDGHESSAAEQLAGRVLEALAAVPDPCMAFARLDISVRDLGLVRDVRVDGDVVAVDLTFTELGCSFSHHLVEEVRSAVEAVEGVGQVRVSPVFTPLWSRAEMTAAAQDTLAESVGRLSTIAHARGLQPPTHVTQTPESP
jgi:metal-sulfur cluster biosynthetic enzyme